MNPGLNENPEIQTPPSPAASLPPGASGRIQWGLFFRAASPLAVITGVVAYLFFPIGLLLALPLSLKRIISRYRPFHAGSLRPSQGAILGAFMALLTFIAFLVFALPTLSLNRGAMLDMLREKAAETPDPQAHQLAQWFTTNEGFVFLTACGLVLVLMIFMAAGAVSGAVITRPRKRPLIP